MVAINSAVAGIEPVEPAAITGPSGRCGQPRRFGLDQRVAPGRRLDGAALGEDFRPGLAGDLQEFEGQLPVAIEIFGHQPVEAVP